MKFSKSALLCSAAVLAISGSAVAQFAVASAPASRAQSLSNASASTLPSAMNAPANLNDLGRQLVVQSVEPDNDVELELEELWWDNSYRGDNPGEPDGIAAYQSQELGSFFSRVADDFFLQKGLYYDVDTITVCMAVHLPEFEPDEYGKVPSVESLFRLDIYSDCNGKPNDVLASFTAVEAVPSEFASPWPDFEIYDVTFQIGQICGSALCDDGEEPFENNLCEGYNRYWVSPVGLGEGLFYWVSAGDGNIQGVQGQIDSPAYGTDGFKDIDECPCGGVCTDFYFFINGEICTLLKDNKEYDAELDGLPAIKFPNTQLDGVRAADNFQVPPFQTPNGNQRICRLELYFLTNCRRFVVEILPNDCDAPDHEAKPLVTLTIDETDDDTNGDGVVDDDDADTGDDGTVCLIEEDVDGTGLDLVKLVFEDIDSNLLEGFNYWVAAYAIGTGSINDRGIWLFHDNPDDCKDINITEAQYKNPFLGIDEFTPVSDDGLEGEARDFAFRLYTRSQNNDPGPSQGDNATGGVVGNGGDTGTMNQHEEITF
mgnify:CR=1 FL=1